MVPNTDMLWPVWRLPTVSTTLAFFLMASRVSQLMISISSIRTPEQKIAYSQKLSREKLSPFLPKKERFCHTKKTRSEDAMRWDRMTVMSQEAFQAAQAKAEEMGRQEVRPEHLLWSFLGQEENVVNGVLTKLGVTPQKIRLELDRAIDRLDRKSTRLKSRHH